MSQLAVGDILENRYRVDHPIARGGMSTVYRCVDLRLGRAVAAKVMHSHYVDDPVFRERFRREARAMAQLSHPNLVGVYDFSSTEDMAFLVMELITGGTLRELLAERGPMPPHAATAVMRAVLTGLSVAHKQGMVHRDIKPDNILINGDHQVKLGDFGLVRAVSGRNLTSGTIIGTVSYLSPEQVNDAEITPASDVYSAGIVLFELLTGTTPFAGNSDIAHALKRLTEDVPAPSSLIDGVPALFDQLVATATMRDPAERFTDAGEFLAALDDVARELDLPAYTVPVPTDSAAHRAAAVPTDTTGIIDHTKEIDQTPQAPAVPPAEETRADLGAVQPTTVPPLPASAPPPPAAARPPAAPPAETRQEIVAEKPPAPPPVPVTQEKPVTNRSPWRLIISLIIVAVLTAAVALGGWWFGSGRYGEVPVLLGMSADDAVISVEEAGFVPVTVLEYHDEAAENEVFGTQPPPGDRVLPGDAITLLVSLGQPVVPEIPEGIGVEDYRALAAERTLAVDTGESVFSDSAPTGAIAHTQPEPGVAVPVGSTVTVHLSKGPEPAIVPDVEGQPLSVVREMLADANLNLGEVTEEFHDVIYGGNVISAEPGPGTQLRAGERVDVVVSTALRIPNVIGMSTEEAQAALADAGFDVRTTTSSSAVAENFDTIVETSPEADTLLDPEADPEVTIVRAGSIPTPDVTGMTMEEAQEVLEAADLAVRGVSSRNKSEVVASQTPAAGEPVTRRGRVSLRS